MKTVVITGATAGIGRATALQFDRAGHRVGAYGRNPAALEALRAELGPDAVVDTLDVRDAGQWNTRLKDLADRSGGQLDVLSTTPAFSVPAASPSSRWRNSSRLSTSTSAAR